MLNVMLLLRGDGGWLEWQALSSLCVSICSPSPGPWPDHCPFIHPRTWTSSHTCSHDSFIHELLSLAYSKTQSSGSGAVFFSIVVLRIIQSCMRRSVSGSFIIATNFLIVFLYCYSTALCFFLCAERATIWRFIICASSSTWSCVLINSLMTSCPFLASSSDFLLIS